MAGCERWEVVGGSGVRTEEGKVWWYVRYGSGGGGGGGGGYHHCYL